MSVVLPSKLLFQTKIEGASARSYKANIQPQNGMGPYNANETIIINIPTHNNLVLIPSESYLKFDLQVKNGSIAANYMRMDSNGAHGLIKRIRVFSGSNLLQDIDNYGMLAKIMMDIQQPSDASYGKNSILVGTRSDLSVVPIGANGTILRAQQTNSGYRFNDEINSVTKALEYKTIAPDQSTIKKTFCLNLISLVGTLCAEKYFPLFGCTSSPLKVEILLSSNVSEFVCCDKQLNSFSVSNCEYIAQMLELSDAAMSTILNQTGGGPLQFVVSDFKNFSTTGNSMTNNVTTTQLSIPIAAKYSSLKSIFISQRPTDNGPNLFPYSSNKFNIQDYHFRIGSQTIPSNYPNTSTEMFSELIKAIGSMSDINHQPSIDNQSYNQDYHIENNDSLINIGSVSSGSFYIGLDLENFASADRSQLFAGLNTNTDDIYFNPTYGKTDVARSIRFDSFVMFDSVMVFENNTVYCKF